jgi:2-desacetyl-2-hydroxyethyl bacteriochlorophyllide A dehydrogenase
MRTIICEEPNKFVLKETEMPDRKPQEAHLRIRRIGICGTDLHAFKGNQPYFVYPRILGHELAAEVVEIDDNEGGIRVGDLVTIVPYLECGRCIACRSGRTNCCVSMSVLGVHQDGGMREYMTVPADHLLKAEGLTADQTAIVECLAIGAHAVRRAGIVRGEYALVIGAGPIGLGVMKFAKLAGAKVIALDINDDRLAFCTRWDCADYTVNALRNPVQEIKDITDGEFPTVVFDATGSAKSMEGAISYVAHSGRLVYVGLVKADISFSDPEFHKREMSIMSSRNATKEDFAQVLDAIRSGHVDTGAFISHRSPFDQMIDAFDSWLKPETGVIKAIVELD